MSGTRSGCGGYSLGVFAAAEERFPTCLSLSLTGQHMKLVGAESRVSLFRVRVITPFALLTRHVIVSASDTIHNYRSTTTWLAYVHLK
jgi:hypothetical protein